MKNKRITNPRMWLRQGLLAACIALSALDVTAQSLVEKWINTLDAATSNRDMDYNPATGNILWVRNNATLMRFQSSDGSRIADVDTTGVSGGTFALTGLSVLPDGTIFGCNYIAGAQSTTPLRLYVWANESSSPTEVWNSGTFLLPGTTAARYGTFMDMFTTATTTNWLFAGNQTSALLLVYNGTYTLKTLTVPSQSMTSGGIFIDYNAPGNANKFRAIAKTRQASGALLSFDPSAASPIAATSTTMGGGYAFVANGLHTPGDYDPATKMIGAVTCTRQATPFTYTNMLFSAAGSLTTPAELSRVVKETSAADGGSTSYATAWGTDGRLYVGAGATDGGLICFDVTVSIVTPPANTFGIVGSSASLTVVAGGSGTLTYEWKKGATVLSDDAKYSGTTTASLTVNNLALADTDDYTVTITGAGGSTASATAHLTVNLGPVGPKTWTGGGANDNFSTAGNWGGSALNFAGDTAFFDGTTRLTPVMDGTYDLAGLTFNPTAGAFDISASSGTLMLSGGVTNSSSNEQVLSLPISIPAARTFNTASGNIVVDDAISGAGSLTKLGAQTLKLQGSSPNAFAGALNLNAGTVALGKSDGVAAVVGAANVATNTVLAVEGSEQITDTSLVELQTGGGKMTIAAGKTETIMSFSKGGTDRLTVSNVVGSVELGANAQLIVRPDASCSVGQSAVGITAANPIGTKFIVESAGGEVRWTPKNMTNNYEKLVIRNNGRLRLGHGGNAWNGQDRMLGAEPALFMQDQITIDNGKIGFNGADLVNKIMIHPNRGQTISNNATNETFSPTVFPGKITGTGKLYHDGGADLELTGANDFSGGLVLGSGGVVVPSAAGLGSGPISFISNLGRLATSTDGVIIPNLIDLSAVITNTFGYVNSFTLSGDVNLGDSGSSPQIRVTNAATTVTFTGKLTNSLGLVKNGAGKVVLTGDNTYLGFTTVLEGTLVANNTSGSATSTGDVDVQAAGTLAGTGSVAGAVTVTGTLSPGNSVGNLTSGNQTWTPAGHYKWEINNATGTAGSGWDKATINGILFITASSGGTFIIDVVSLAGTAPGNAANFNTGSSYSWVIASTTGGVSGFDPSAFTINTAEFGNAMNTTFFNVEVVGNDIVLKYAPPAPPTDFTATVSGGIFTGGTFTGSPNTSYSVKYTDSLNPVNWQTLTTVVTDGTGAGSFTDPGPLPDQRFYRITAP